MSSDIWALRHEQELIQLANNDPVAALKRLEALSKHGASISAEIALHVAIRCFHATAPPRPKRKRGRPPRSFTDVVERLSDGKASIEGTPLSKERSPREIERCKAEYRACMARVESGEADPPRNAQI